MTIEEMQGTESLELSGHLDGGGGIVQDDSGFSNLVEDVSISSD